MEVISDHPAVEEMQLMAMADHHIIANSSFSWWGAWLNPSEEKTVIAPRHWLARSDKVTSYPLDIYEDNWIALG